ncbi:MAG: hypothetical protein WCW13_02865 [archaeon]|jgi:hypothetical protein
MTLAKLEGDLLKVRDDLTRAKQANVGFEKILQEMSILKSRSIANPATKEQIVSELKNKEILDLFASVETDFEDLRQQMAKQSIEKESILDFIESIRTKKTFCFTENEKSINFLEKSLDVLDADQVSVRPEFIGLLDLSGLAIEMGLLKNNSGVIVEKERFSEFIVALHAKKMFHDLVFETDKARMVLKNSREILVEAENSYIRSLNRVAKPVTVY